MTCKLHNPYKPHKWSKEIKAWGDGHIIQSKPILTCWIDDFYPTWTDNRAPNWDGPFVFRIKPEIVVDNPFGKEPVPWLLPPLNEWSIVGMNHYKLNGNKLLFVAMTKDGRCIQEEGIDDDFLWGRLCYKAQKETG